MQSIVWFLIEDLKMLDQSERIIASGGYLEFPIGTKTIIKNVWNWTLREFVIFKFFSETTEKSSAKHVKK